MDAHFYLLRDTHGREVVVATHDPFELVSVRTLRKNTGEMLNFYSDAANLRKWAERNGLEFRKCIKRYTFAELWKLAE